MSDALNRSLVNDHAVIRFLERVYGLDVEAVRAAIVAATDAGREAGDAIGAPEFAIVVERIRFVVDHGQVVTALSSEMTFNPKNVRRSRRGHA